MTDLRQAALEQQQAEPVARENFEKWAKSLPNYMDISRFEAGYSDCNTDYAWVGWQAALAPPQQQAKPVAWMYQHEETGRTAFIEMSEHKDGWKPSSSRMKLIGPLYTTPPQQQAEPAAWTPVAEALPKSGEKVLACYRHRWFNLRPIRAFWTAAKTEAADSDDARMEYDAATDAYYVPEGWYECIDNWGDYSSVAVTEGEITHWMPLPQPPLEAAHNIKEQP